MKADDLFAKIDKYRIVRRVAIIWWMGIATWMMFWAVEQPVITDQIVALVEIVFGVSAAVFGLYTAGRVLHETRRSWGRRKPDSPDDMVG